MARESLVNAVMKRDVPELRRLLQQPGLSASMRLDDGSATLLHVAALTRAPEIISTLIDAGGDVNAVDQTGATPFGVALSARNEPVALQLLDAGADPACWPATVPAPLAFAVLYGFTRLTDRLLSLGASPHSSVAADSVYGADAEVRVQQQQAPATGAGGKLPPPLSLAVMQRSAALTATLLAAGASPDVRSSGTRGSAVAPAAGNDAAPLLIAVANRDTPLVKMLLKAGADATAMGVINGNLHSPIGLACYNQASVELVEALLDAGANPDTARGATPHPLTSAVGANNVALTRLLLSRGGADPNIIRDANGLALTPLFDALEARYDEVALALVEAGANPDAAVVYDEAGSRCSPLMYAAYFNSVPLVRALIAAGAQVNFKASAATPITALHMAAVCGYSEVTNALLAAGADVAAAIDGVTPLQMALTQGFADVAAQLVAAGAPLTPAAFADHATVAKVFSRFFFTLEDVCPDGTVSMLYAARRRGSAAALGDLPTPFGEYITPGSDAAVPAAVPAGAPTVYGGAAYFTTAAVPTTDAIITLRRKRAVEAAKAAKSAAPATGASTAAAAAAADAEADDDEADVEITVTPAAAVPVAEDSAAAPAADAAAAAPAGATVLAAESGADLDHSTRMALPLRQKPISELFKFNSLEANAVFLPSVGGATGWHPLVNAAWLGDAALVRAILARCGSGAGAGVGAATGVGAAAAVTQADLTVALAWAAVQGNTEAARALLAAGASATAPIISDAGDAAAAAAAAAAAVGPLGSPLLRWTVKYERAEADRWRAAAADAAGKERTREKDVWVRRAAVADLVAAQAAAATAAAQRRQAGGASATTAQGPARRTLDQLVSQAVVGTERAAAIDAAEREARARIDAAAARAWGVHAEADAGAQAQAQAPAATALDLARLRGLPEMVALLTGKAH
jgi:ankyrin repeat protein